MGDNAYIILWLQHVVERLESSVEWAAAQIRQNASQGIVDTTGYERVRVWKDGTYTLDARFLDGPTEDTPPDQWEWKEFPCMPECLEGVVLAIQRLRDDISRLRGDLRDAD